MSRQRSAGRVDQLIDLGALRVERLLILAQLGGRALDRIRRLGRDQPGDVGLDPLSQRDSPPDEVIDGRVSD